MTVKDFAEKTGFEVVCAPSPERCVGGVYIGDLLSWVMGKAKVRDMIAVGEKHGACWYSVGARSKKGHPHHPLYLRKDAVTEPFDVSAYLDILQTLKK